MSARLSTTRAAALAAVAAFAGAASVYALANGVDRAAEVDVPAVRAVQPIGDLAVVFDVGDVDREVIDLTDAAARRVGATASTSRSGSLGMQRMTRNGATVHAPPAGYLIPMVYISLPDGAVGGVMGADVSQVLTPDSVVMNEVTASITGAQVGDVVVMQSRTGSVVPLTVAGIRSYDQIGWAELVFTFDVAERLGATADTRVVVWDIDDRQAFDDAVADVGLLTRRDTKVNRSWDPPDPDDTLSTARTKVALGEPWYTLTADGSISMHPTWQAANLAPGRVLLNETIRIRARCHVQVEPALRAALAEVAAAGLAGAIDVANANSAGGCYVPRYSRTSGFLSRHTYGMALDTNTQSNCNGCVPQMDCRVVRIFRKHGFAWGGNFRRPDGMHFEWVGEPRDQISFPSTYCPNIVNPLTEDAQPGPVGAGVLTAGGEGMVHSHHDHPHGS
ncbi:MAG: M15 family metallopeptidase [Ilumatobacter sp.]|uniref:M15 family metallopeptidase n=1 Tax=Ilumatobacter sp. TaxID=1967498 RepID=UPI0026097F53|nr:M15 family metallopeptidase [Ilumatobacter sp.]MDJ0768090.1 M15 family metallopeptidase [Ilumatobacter sp.]